MNRKSGSSISRREFARRAAIVSAATLVPAASLNLHAGVAEPLPQQPSDTPGLSAESRAEAEARYQTILGMYGSRFSDPQKTDLQRLCLQVQPSLDHLRTHSVENGDGPALYLKPLVEREKKSEFATTTHMAGQATKKP